MTFSNPPIVEAIFHVVVERDSDFNNEKLNDYAKYITESYPAFDRQEQRFLKNDISFHADDPHNITSSISNILQGYLLASNDNPRVIQANIDNFSFSKLRPYGTWESFYKEANEFWSKYAEITSVDRVNRLGLRYLNRIVIPFEGRSFKLEEYIKIFPEVSDDLSMIISGYFMQISLVSEQYKPSVAVVNQTVGNIEKNGDKFSTPLIFDVEVFQDVNLSSQDSSIESIFINNLRPFKNDVFLKGITEKAQEFFK
jgi:uncharacterized protein (TIGR04255 family)